MEPLSGKFNSEGEMMYSFEDFNPKDEWLEKFKWAGEKKIDKFCEEMKLIIQGVMLKGAHS